MHKTRIVHSSMILLALGCSGGIAAAQPTLQAGADTPAPASPQTPAPLAETTFISTISTAPAGSTCATVSGSASYSTSPKLAQCNGTPAQSFDFTPVAGRAGTYVITNTASHLCLANYRFGLRQLTCLHQANEGPQQWTLRPVNAATQDYQVVVTLTDYTGYTYEKCMTASAPHSSVLGVAACLPGQDITQTFHLEGKAG